MMAGNENMHPAAEVFLNHIISGVDEENNHLLSEVDRLKKSSRFLGDLSFHLRSGGTISASLASSWMINDFHGNPSLAIALGGASAYSLSEFRSGQVKMAGQLVGELPGVQAPVLKVNTANAPVEMRIVFSPTSVLEGELRGVSPDDISESKVARFLQTGEGLPDSESVEFVPHVIYMFLDSTIRDTIRILGVDMKVESVEKPWPLPADPHDRLKCPSTSPADVARLTIVRALGGTETQMMLLDDNLILKEDQFQRTKAAERLAAVHVHQSNFTSPSISLRDGTVVEDENGALVWQLSPKLGGKDPVGGFPLMANFIHSFGISVSGVYSHSAQLQLLGSFTGVESLQRREFTFVVTFESARIEGFWDHISLLEMNAVGRFEDFVAGNIPSPPEFTAVATLGCPSLLKASRRHWTFWESRSPMMALAMAMPLNPAPARLWTSCKSCICRSMGVEFDNNSKSASAGSSGDTMAKKAV